MNLLDIEGRREAEILLKHVLNSQSTGSLNKEVIKVTLGVTFEYGHCVLKKGEARQF